MTQVVMRQPEKVLTQLFVFWYDQSVGNENKAGAGCDV
jgi:hypothetical protein